MNFFQNLLGPPPPPAVPVALPKITLPTAAQIAQSSQPGAAAQQLLTPQQTPSQYLAALQEKQMGDEMVKTMAHGLPDKEGVMWAAQSAGKVADKLPATDVQAMQAAQAWAQNPSPATQAAAAAAAAKTDLQGPGAWAAQAAAWAKPDVPAATRLTPHAVSAAVLLASAIAANPKLTAPKVQVPAPTLPASAMPAVEVPQAAAPQSGPPPAIPPKVQAQTFKSQHPFIAMGIDLASGKLPPA